MGQCSPQNLVSSTDGAGRDCRDLDYGRLCVWVERVEDAHPGCDLPTLTVCGALVVRDLDSLFYSFCVIDLWPLRLKLATTGCLCQVASRISSVAPGQWEDT